MRFSEAWKGWHDGDANSEAPAGDGSALHTTSVFSQPPINQLESSSSLPDLSSDNERASCNIAYTPLKTRTYSLTNSSSSPSIHVKHSPSLSLSSSRLIAPSLSSLFRSHCTQQIDDSKTWPAFSAPSASPVDLPTSYRDKHSTAADNANCKKRWSCGLRGPKPPSGSETKIQNFKSWKEEQTDEKPSSRKISRQFAGEQHFLLALYKLFTSHSSNCLRGPIIIQQDKKRKELPRTK